MKPLICNLLKCKYSSSEEKPNFTIGSKILYSTCNKLYNWKIYNEDFIDKSYISTICPHQKRGIILYKLLY